MPRPIRTARTERSLAVPKAKVARDLNVSRQTLYAALKGSGKYAHLTAH